MSTPVAPNRANSAPLSIMNGPVSVKNAADIKVVLEDVFKEKGELAQRPHILWERKMGFSGASVREVECHWKSSKAFLPNRIFIKNIALEPPKNVNEDALYKWRRNRQSYINEVTFLENYAPTLEEIGVKVPNMLKVLQYGTPEGEGDNAESFLFISESMNRPGVQQAIELEDTQFASALRWLAGLHACYQGKMPVEYENVDNMDEERKHVWREGTHLALSKRPTSELVNLPDNWASFAKPLDGLNGAV